MKYRAMVFQSGKWNEIEYSKEAVEKADISGLIGNKVVKDFNPDKPIGTLKKIWREDGKIFAEVELDKSQSPYLHLVPILDIGIFKESQREVKDFKVKNLSLVQFPADRTTKVELISELEILDKKKR